jgi:putative membrane protein insertion efficiency factor
MTSIILFFIRLYQYTLSSVMGVQCRFRPTCSYYTAEAVRRFGPLRGLALGARRICRCHPWAVGGHDPVPETFPRKSAHGCARNHLTNPHQSPSPP